MSRNWYQGTSETSWWIQRDDARITIVLSDRQYFVTDDDLDIGEDVLAGPFDTLDAAKAAYLLIGRRT